MFKCVVHNVVIRLGPKTSECEKNVSVKSTVTSCDVTYCATTLHGFNKQVCRFWLVLVLVLFLVGLGWFGFGLVWFLFWFFVFLCLTIHIVTAQHLLFSACTLDVTSTVMTRMHVRSSMRAHSPLSGSSVKESCAQDTEQKHGKHASGALLSSFPLLLVVVLAEHGGCLSSVDRDRGLRNWNEREARRNECETRCWW